MSTSRFIIPIGGRTSTYHRGVTPVRLHVAGDPTNDHDIGEAVYNVAEVDGEGYYFNIEDTETRKFDLVIKGVKNRLWRNFFCTIPGASQSANRIQFDVTLLETVEAGQGCRLAGYDTENLRPQGALSDPTSGTNFLCAGVYITGGDVGDLATVVQTGLATNLPETYPANFALVIGTDGFLTWAGEANYPNSDAGDRIVQVGTGHGQAGSALLHGALYL